MQNKTVKRIGVATTLVVALAASAPSNASAVAVQLDVDEFGRAVVQQVPRELLTALAEYQPAKPEDKAVPNDSQYADINMRVCNCAKA